MRYGARFYEIRPKSMLSPGLPNGLNRVKDKGMERKNIGLQKSPLAEFYDLQSYRIAPSGHAQLLHDMRDNAADSSGMVAV
jgi:hypothetical protein